MRSTEINLASPMDLIALLAWASLVGFPPQALPTYSTPHASSWLWHHTSVGKYQVVSQE